MKSDSPVSVVCDAGPLIHLDELGCLDLLGDFAILFIPQQVWQEVEKHRPVALTHLPANVQQVAVTLDDEPVLQSLIESLALALGEQAGLSLLRNHPNALFLTDDAAARLAAQSLGYRVHGTLGILLRAIRRVQRTRDEVLSILHELPTRSTLYISAKLLQQVIREVEQTSH